MIYYTSDLHFGHKAVIKFCDRPFSNVDEMNNDLVRRWNARVTDEDEVYVLGDFCFSYSEFKHFCNRLNGTKHFVLGNHDPKNIEEKNIPNVVFRPPIYEVEDPTALDKLVLCHYPIHEWNGFFKDRVHFHGHTHGTIGRSFRKNAYDICTDLHNYEPKTYREITGL